MKFGGRATTDAEIEEKIRYVLRAHRKRDVSTRACRTFAKVLIQQYIKGWTPGTPLDHKQAQKVGREFVKLYRSCKK